ncbi:MAG: hypothetical protein HQQ73_06655 [Desulfobulbaceae bacterium]|jgi:mono/diheme cytochrome c family protein|nr:hypothetical protein [Desulfobulbaceae bacterium]
MTAKQKRKIPVWLINLLFVLVCGTVLFFLWQAPPVSTPPLPKNAEHAPFFDQPRKEAEKQCAACHGPEMENPLPDDHPPPHRCLFCHRRGG